MFVRGIHLDVNIEIIFAGFMLFMSRRFIQQADPHVIDLDR